MSDIADFVKSGRTRPCAAPAPAPAGFDYPADRLLSLVTKGQGPGGSEEIMDSRGQSMIFQCALAGISTGKVRFHPPAATNDKAPASPVCAHQAAKSSGRSVCIVDGGWQAPHDGRAFQRPRGLQFHQGPADEGLLGR